MKNFIVLIVQLCGFAFLFVALISVVNLLTGWELGYKGSEVPSDPEFAIVFLVLGLIVTPIGIFLSKKLS